MTVYPLVATFSRGELSPRLHARVDLAHYRQALKRCLNWIVMRQGGLKRRRGFRFIAPLRDESESGRLIRFEFDEQQAYAICFNDSKIRFFTQGGQVTMTPQNISAITKANPAVITYSGSDTFANGDRVWLSGIVGMTEMNNREVTVANVNTGANTFEASGVNSTGYTTYSSGGTVAEIYEIASPYFESDLKDIKFTQSGDTIYLAHPSYAQRKLVRTSETSWALSTIQFENGPWLDEDEQGTYLTPGGTGGITPAMTNNTSPSGTASNSAAGANAYKVFDRTTTGDTIAATTGNWEYDTGGATKVVDAYWIRALRTGAGNQTPTSWTFEGSADGSTWIILDARVGETLWAPGEVRYYEFINAAAYRYHRLNFYSNDGGASTSIEELGIHESGDTQTAFTLSASSVTGINGGAGFKSTDVGRVIRLMGSDAGLAKRKQQRSVVQARQRDAIAPGKWRWAVIVSRTSSTVVTVRLYGHALPDLSALTRWQMSSWSADNGYPAAVGFFEDRLTWAHSFYEEKTVWASQTSDYVNHGLTVPNEDTDGMNITINGGRLNRINWLADLEGLVMGTPGGIRVMDAPDGGSPFSSTNVREKRRAVTGASSLQPMEAGSNLIFADRFKTHIHELSFDLNAGGYGTRDLSILSEHLYSAGVTEFAFQVGEDDVGWTLITDGTLSALTYEPDQQIEGVTQVIVAGGGTSDAEVESVVSIPADGGDDLYAIVSRTVNGTPRRFVEYMRPTT